MTKVTAIGILVIGVLALVYGGLRESQHNQEANVGPLEIGLGLAIVSGGVLTKRRS